MKTKTKTIQQPERYEAPGIKVKMLRRRAVLTASLSITGDTEGMGSTGTYSINGETEGQENE